MLVPVAEIRPELLMLARMVIAARVDTPSANARLTGMLDAKSNKMSNSETSFFFMVASLRDFGYYQLNGKIMKNGTSF